MNRTKKMVTTSLLIAMAIIIPVSFGFLRIIIGPFTATIGAHIPMFVSMLISPKVAAAVGFGSGMGFVLAGMPAPVVARALMHIPVGVIGAKIIEKKKSMKYAALITSILHGILEGLVVIPFGFSMYEIVIVTAVGAILHHLADAGLTVLIFNKVASAMKKDMYVLFK